MSYQKYKTINIPNNMEVKQIFIAQNTFDYGMILQKGDIFKLYKNGLDFGDNINFNFNPYGIISNNGTIIRTPYYKESLGRGLVINGIIPQNYYKFLGICNSGEIEISKNRKYSFAYGIDENNNKFLIRNDEKLLNLEGFDDNYIFSDNGENFLVISDNNKLYLNGKKELYSISIENEIIFYKLFDNLEWILVYRNSNNFYIIKNGKEINKITLEQGLFYEGFLNINNDGTKIYLLISKEIESEDKYGVSINGKNTRILFSDILNGESISPYSRFYGNSDFFISFDKNTVIYKCRNSEKRKYFVVQDENVIFESKNLVDDESSFYLGDVKGFESKDIDLIFNITKSNYYWKKYNELNENIQKDFDKIESLIIGDDGIVKFIGYKGDDIGLYYFDKNFKS